MYVCFTPDKDNAMLCYIVDCQTFKFIDL